MTTLTPSSPSSGGPRLVILVVDDSPALRLCVVQMLGKIFEAPTVLEAGDGEQALALLRRQGPGPGLVITDLGMPTMDGLQLLGVLRRTPGWAQLPVLLISGDGFDPAAPPGREDPFFRTLDKPFGLPELRAKLAELLPPP